MAETKTKKKYYLGTGRRKSAVARVRLADGNGKIVINQRDLDDYFTEDKDRAAVVGPLELTEMRNRLGRQQMTKLKIYAGPNHPHQAQQPVPYDIKQIAQ